MAVKLIEESKTLSESKTFTLKFGEKSQMPKDFDQDLVMDFDADGIEVYPKSDDIACPWDANCFIEDGKFVMIGGLTPGGAGYNGKCTVEVPVANVSKYYDIKITCSSDKEKELSDVLRSYGLI